ncbi:MAG: ParB N-terminal domain-containing protein [Planctomycetota bacterium]
MIRSPENTSLNVDPKPARVRLDEIIRHPDSRKIDESRLPELTTSIREYGLVIPPALSEHEGRYICIDGNHRIVALRSLRTKEVLAMVWPEGMSREQILLLSMHANHIRQDETPDATLMRVEALARYHNCKVGEAAGMAKISASKLSKIKRAQELLVPDALRLCRQEKVGLAIRYAVGMATSDGDKQVELLRQSVAGEITRKQIESINREEEEPKLTLTFKLGDVEHRLNVPAEAGYELLMDALAELKRNIVTHAKRDTPLDLLSRLIASESTKTCKDSRQVSNA